MVGLGDRETIYRWTGSASDAILELPGGELLLPAWGFWEDDTVISSHLYASTDEGETWTYRRILARDPAQVVSFDEPALGLVAGRVVAVFRTDYRGSGFLYQSESFDLGRTWSEPRALSIWGYPAHLMVTRDGRTLMTYGYRQLPYGVRYRLAPAGGSDWEMAWEGIADAECQTWDCGYPSSVELSDGSVVVIYYGTDELGTVIRAARLLWD